VATDCLNSTEPIAGDMVSDANNSDGSRVCDRPGILPARGADDGEGIVESEALAIFANLTP
jgi:hypothetical protein